MLGFQTQTGTGGREGLELDKWLQTIEVAGARRAPGRRGPALRDGLVLGLGDVRHARGRPGQARRGLRLPLDALSDALRRPRVGRARASTPPSPRGRSGFRAGSSARSAARRSPRRSSGRSSSSPATATSHSPRCSSGSAERRVVPVSTAQMLAAERTVIATRFGGSAAAYRSALAAAHATVPVARQILADQLRRARIEATLPKSSPRGVRDRDVLPRLPGPARALGRGRAGGAVARRARRRATRSPSWRPTRSSACARTAAPRCAR